MYDPMTVRAIEAAKKRILAQDPVELVLIVLTALREPSEEIQEVVTDVQTWQLAIDHLRNPFVV